MSGRAEDFRVKVHRLRVGDVYGFKQGEHADFIITRVHHMHHDSMVDCIWLEDWREARDVYVFADDVLIARADEPGGSE